MNLTEPQAGSDVGALKTRAVRSANGDHYLITGQKIYITWGEHDCADNIVHMVLARTPDAPAGTKGISLFLVPKFLRQRGRQPRAERNDLRCVSIEHKLGIHASPTAVMAYGDDGGAVGYLVGEENQGMACMFTMMNNARLAVGLQGVAIAERAYQQALAYARERKQAARLGRRTGTVRRAIIRHHGRAPHAHDHEAPRPRRPCALGLLVNAGALDRAKREPGTPEGERRPGAA